MLIEIKHRWSGAVLFSLECGSMRLCVEAAILAGADLSGADLAGADLVGADLREAKLRKADLSEADLSAADLRGAKLRKADLSGANLRGAKLRNADLSEADLSAADLRAADLVGADLREAKLRKADLSEADLSGANLYAADLSEANLRAANLTPIRDDLWAVLSAAPAEVAGLRQALVEGRVDGTCYEGECACLVGTLANVRGCSYEDLGLLATNSSRPAERFFLSIRQGHTPENSQHAKLAVEWIDQWLSGVRAAAESGAFASG